MKVERVLAPNPGPYTGPGTNTYLVDEAGDVVIVDPGPDDDRHLAAIVEALGDRTARFVVVTHTHEDHAPLANRLAGRLGVEAAGPAPGPGFKPDRLLADGDVVGMLRAVATPGHSPDHLCYLAGKALFTGDHIMGGSSVMVEDLSAYLASLRKLQTLDLEVLYPGHGPAEHDPQAVIAGYIAHRLERERQILDAIHAGAHTVADIVAHVYADVDPTLHPAAAVSVRAHLRKLIDDGVIDEEQIR